MVNKRKIKTINQVSKDLATRKLMWGMMDGKTNGTVEQMQPNHIT